MPITCIQGAKQSTVSLDVPGDVAYSSFFLFGDDSISKEFADFVHDEIVLFTPCTDVYVSSSLMFGFMVSY